jgi:membrane protein YdbS with pleckstrin-like domain
VLLGTLVFAAIIRLASRRVRTFRVVAVAALALSMLNPIGAAAGWVPVGATLGLADVLAMMAMHVVAAAITIYLLPTLARER